MPGFWSRYAAVGRTVGRRGPKPGAEVRSTVAFSYNPGGRTLGSDDELITFTVPVSRTKNIFSA